MSNPALALAAAYALGSIPFSNLIARISSGMDLRHHGSKTVSGTSVYRVAGFLPLVAAGLLDVSKGVGAAFLAEPGSRPVLAAGAAGVAVVGHNWSVFLGGKGGRGVSVALGATVVLAWPGTVLIALGLAVGKLFGHTGFGCFAALLLLPALLYITHAGAGAVLGGALAIPILGKRVTANASPARDDRRAAYLSRLLFDNEEVL